MDRFAVISDIHGNRWALEAVLEDLDQAGILAVLNLGDVLYGPLDPAGTADLLIPRAFPTVRGNEDRIIVEQDAPVSNTLAFVRGQLTSSHIDWLEALPAELVLENKLLCHGSPSSDTAYLLWDISESGALPRRSQDVTALLAHSNSELFLCGHDHVPNSLRLGERRLVVNPGSVGLPAYSDDAPHPHVMQTGTPHARYCVMTRRENGWLISDRAVPYDWGSAVDAANSNGRPDWAHWLSTGQADRKTVSTELGR